MTAGPLPPAPLTAKARLIEIEDCWLELHCGRCGRISMTAVKLLIRRLGPGVQLGAILFRLRCQQCKVPPVEAWLKSVAETISVG